MEGYGKSWKVKGNHHQIDILGEKSYGWGGGGGWWVCVLQDYFEFRIWDLDLGPGFWTWILDWTLA